MNCLYLLRKLHWMFSCQTVMEHDHQRSIFCSKFEILHVDRSVFLFLQNFHNPGKALVAASESRTLYFVRV